MSSLPVHRSGGGTLARAQAGCPAARDSRPAHVHRKRGGPAAGDPVACRERAGAWPRRPRPPPTRPTLRPSRAWSRPSNRRSSRERFIADLKTALEAQQAAEAGEDAEGASAMRAISDGVAVLGKHIVELAREIAGIPDAIAWLVEHWGEPSERDAWLISFGKLAGVMAGGIIGGLIAFFALTTLRRRVERREAPSPLAPAGAAALSLGAQGGAQPDRGRRGLWRAHRDIAGRLGSGDRARHHQRASHRERGQGSRHPGAGALRAAASPRPDHGRERRLLLGLVAAPGEHRSLRLRLLPGGAAARPAGERPRCADPPARHPPGRAPHHLHPAERVSPSRAGCTRPGGPAARGRTSGSSRSWASSPISGTSRRSSTSSPAGCWRRPRGWKASSS